MAWNGSDSVGSAPRADRGISRNRGRATSTKSPPAQGTRHKSHGTRHGLLAGLVVVVLGGAAVWWFFGRDGSLKTDPSSSPHTPRKIAEVKPSIVSNAWSRESVSSEKPMTKRVVDHPPTNQWGNPWHWGPNKKLKPTSTSSLDRASMPMEERIFRNSAERTIAGLLMIEPGDELIGSDEPSPWFKRSFLKSLKEPTLASDTDTEEEKELKQFVNETKAELKARMDAGEDIVQIITDTRKELRELGAYREDLKKQINEFRKKGNITAEDMKDFVTAANQMLEQRGLKKIVMPDFYYKQLEYRNTKRNIRKEK